METIDETPAATNTRNYLLADFEGPLDLLLFLIKKNEVSIYDIPIASITEQFLRFLDGMEHPDLDNLTEFYSLAATLLYIKSRMLLPVEIDLSEEIEDPRQDLVEKLIEYQKFKKISELMEQKELEAEWSLERKKIQRPLPFNDNDLWDEIDVWDLLKSFSVMIGGISSERIIDLYEEVSINEKTALIQEFLENRESFSFHDLLTRHGSTLDIVCAFLALLEAVKFRLISILQHRLFGDIQIRAYHKRSEHGTES
ncbi:MAG: chromosome segregation protein ScpA [Spirochaetes bacterium GWD1_61_31]|nr:MAG: chromosome segregation protein ScpA [Spirochaetes bacterium GWB1_60_80]OHD29579.1 MAG: chromosome segregation protein ScpA [Spirochaetes bacterium GWC1_61_12]OHD37484.1 MAG: chromosome segregation protein ScpA [Spirochaetes bacterium GWD1_61_31]OHD42007.1 MAG: chromosome segregation protein ScpA [Spirochaetes bacterium GWE1_60_18]OHD61726.1 MAG: chromosome segregation protein ScpA [Spirochaetes bacterium GWF1_60_12]